MHGFGSRSFHALVALLVLVGVSPMPASAQEAAEHMVFRSSVDLVTVTAVVRDKKGRVMRSLTRDDFELIDAGQARPFADFQADSTAPASVTLLIDGSGSMAAGTSAARQVAEMLLSQLTPHRDEAALMSFDTRLLTLRSCTGDIDRVRRGFSDLDTFGASSIYDAIAGTAGVVAERTGRRRAVVVITDGSDNASSYTANEVAWIASAIDVPVYVFAVGHDAVMPSDEMHRAWHSATPLMVLARATGGDFFFAGNADDRAAAVARVVDELRHQYLIAFEPSNTDGLHHIEVRTRNSELKVRSRQWYVSGSAD